MEITNGNRYWHGKTCEGGGAYLVHKMNQDLMTPENVVYRVGHNMAIHKMKQIMKDAEYQCNIAAMKHFGINL